MMMLVGRWYAWWCVWEVVAIAVHDLHQMRHLMLHVLNVGGEHELLMLLLLQDSLIEAWLACSELVLHCIRGDLHQQALGHLELKEAGWLLRMLEEGHLWVHSTVALIEVHLQDLQILKTLVSCLHGREVLHVLLG